VISVWSNLQTQQSGISLGSGSQQSEIGVKVRDPPSSTDRLIPSRNCRFKTTALAASVGKSTVSDRVLAEQLASSVVVFGLTFSKALAQVTSGRTSAYFLLLIVQT